METIYLVDCDTSAEDGRSIIKWESIGDGGELRGVGDGELLERSVDGVSGALGGLAQWLVSLSAEFTFLQADKAQQGVSHRAAS